MLANKNREWYCSRGEGFALRRIDVESTGKAANYQSKIYSLTIDHDMDCQKSKPLHLVLVVVEVMKFDNRGMVQRSPELRIRFAIQGGKLSLGVSTV